jgi:hypothetical protein
MCAGCSTLQQDEGAAEAGARNGVTIARVQEPTSPDHHPCTNVKGSCDNASVVNTVVTWLDKFDETQDGKSLGTLYIRDLGAPHPYGGIGIYQSNFVPASLDALPGDVLDFFGPYQESTSIGTAKFPAGTFLAQLYKPVGTYRYEFASSFPPAWSEPMTIQVTDLYENSPNSSGPPKPDGSFAHGRPYLQMLVTVHDVDLAAGACAPGGSGTCMAPNYGGRVTYGIYPHGGTYQTALAPVAISNELFDLRKDDYPVGTHFASVTGIVTWFYTFHIAPRSRDDLVPVSGDAGAD